MDKRIRRTSLVIKNEPSNQFYQDMYEELENMLKSLNVFTGVKITIKNMIGDKKFIEKENVEIGYMFYRRDKNRGLKYTVNLAELSSIEFGNVDWLVLSQLRYGDYLKDLGIQLSPEVLTILTLLHEIGHIEFWENYIENTESDSPATSVASYSNHLASLYAMVMKPWDFCSQAQVNLNHIMFNSIETYPELFSLKHFPRFIKLLKRYGLVKDI